MLGARDTEIKWDRLYQYGVASLMVEGKEGISGEGDA